MRRWGLVLAGLGFVAALGACATAEHAAVVESREQQAGKGPLGPLKEERVEEPVVTLPAAPPQEAASAQEAAAPPAPPPAVVEPPSPFMFDILFDFDRYALREDARDLVEVNASRLKGRDGWELLLEGRGDERGTADYNLVLGERRAQAVKGYLETLGLEARALKVISYGKDRPLCTAHSEACWEKNRSVHFSVTIQEDRFYRQIP